MDSAAALNVVIWIVATATTAIGTWFVSRRSGKSTFLADVLKENEYLTGRNHSLEKDNSSLNEQNRALGRENVVLLRGEHESVLNRLEDLVRGMNQGRAGAGGVTDKLDEIHTLVNDRLDRALREIASLKDRLETEKDKP